MPDAFAVFHHLGIRVASALAGLGACQVLALDVPDLGHHDDVFPLEIVFLNELSEDAPDQALTLPVGVVCRSVDQVAALAKREEQGFAVGRFVCTDPVGTEAETAGRETCGA